MARLAQQEMGLSTLFIAFGFLEWRQSEDSEKSHFAPLLLLPVIISARTEKGKKIYSVKATSEEPEINVTLAKHLERENRVLPKFEPDDDCKSPIEDYFALVLEAIDGLPNWRVRRFLTLGHFAFGRLAMYQDIDPSQWPLGVVSHPLVSSILRGVETSKQDDSVVLRDAPEDYEIDTPEVEKLVPLLVHNADASQHSAIVDVMKGDNLVIEGPPGTGKSQTITNIIANALSRDKSANILFLSEKLAALTVVKRRLDTAGLGDFCLELHSDESSPRSVVHSLKRSCDRWLAFGRRKPPPRPINPGSWEGARKEISSYLAGLHAQDNDGATAFDLFWRAIAANGKLYGAPAGLMNAALPNSCLANAEERQDLEAKLRHYAQTAEEFTAQFGKAKESPWFALNARATPGQANDFLDIIRRMEIANSKLLEVGTEADLAGLSIVDLLAIAGKVGELPEPPDLTDVETIAKLLPDKAILAAEVSSKLCEVQRRLVSHSLAGRLDGVDEEAGLRLRDCLWQPSLTQRRAAEILTEAQNVITITRKILSRIEATSTLRELLDANEDVDFNAVPTMCFAAMAAAAVPPDMRPWLSWQPCGDRLAYCNVQERWGELIAADEWWQTKFPKYSPDERPSPEKIRDHAQVLSTKMIALKPWLQDARKKAFAFAELLGLDGKLGAEAAEDMKAFAAHLEAVSSFEADEEAAQAVGPLWQGMSTDFQKMEYALGAREYFLNEFSNLAYGLDVAHALLRLNGVSLNEVASLEEAVAPFCQIGQDEASWASGLSISEARESATTTLRLAQMALTEAKDSGLGGVDAPLTEVIEFAGLLKERQALGAQLEDIPGGVEVHRLIGDQPDVERVVAVAKWARSLRDARLPNAATALILTPDGRRKLAELTSMAERVAAAQEQLTRALAVAGDEFGATFRTDDNGLLGEQLARLLDRRQGLAELLSVVEARRQLVDAGLGQFITAIEKTEIPAAQYPDVFDGIITRRRAERTRNGNQQLKNATGLTLNARRKEFADQDKLKIERDRGLAGEALMQRELISGHSSGPKKGWTEMALIQNEVKKLGGGDDKRKRFANVRALLRQSPASIRALKPCFMMSPLSVSKFLPREMTFDLVVIDEASQMRPEDALGTLLRARQIVVVGDPKQLPPTDFFNRAVDETATADDDSDDVEDESILEACSKAFNNVRHLKWHYRSRCESLIAFSNEQFYGKSLITFPMARPDSFSVDLVKVEGHYQASQNPAEAQSICEAAIELMCRLAKATDQEFGTIGVVAINSPQREAILEQFRLLSAGNDAVERFMERAEKLGEPFFVKNLENVQGDERDYVMISLTYGRRQGHTTVDQTFGPINRSQGHRRLNVLFSRARRRIGLFTSMHSSEIRPTDASKLGVHVLKRYLEYAERGRTAPGVPTGRAFDSPFEEEVCKRLEANGYKVDVQVGVSKFRIDLGVKHPQHPSIYLAGVECDGASFHSSRSARDRDRLREEVLTDLGWKLIRIWSTDWFSDPDTATEKLLRQIKDLETRPLRVAEEIMFGDRVQADRDIPPDDEEPAAPNREAEEPAEHAPLAAILRQNPEVRTPTKSEKDAQVRIPAAPKKRVQMELFVHPRASEEDLFEMRARVPTTGEAPYRTKRLRSLTARWYRRSDARRSP